MLIANLPNHEPTLPTLAAQPEQLRAKHIPITHADLTPTEVEMIAAHEDNWITKLAIGCRVRLFQTADKRRGLTNALAGVVDSFNFVDTVNNGNFTRYLIGVRVKFDNKQRPVSVNRMQAIGKFLHEWHVKMAFWPLALNYAATVHSVQGRSISHPLCLDFQNAFAPGLAYTALSRNTNRNDITLLTRLTPYDLRVASPEAFYAALST